MNRIQNQFFKTFYHLKKCTPNYCIIGEFGIKPIEYHFYKAALYFWIKLKKADERRLIKRVYEMINSNVNSPSFHNTWSHRIRKLFKKVHLLEVLNLPDLLDNVNYKRKINNRLEDYFREEWIDTAKNSNKGLDYLELCRYECNLKRYLNLTNDSKKIFQY